MGDSLFAKTPANARPRAAPHLASAYTCAPSAPASCGLLVVAFCKLKCDRHRRVCRQHSAVFFAYYLSRMFLMFRAHLVTALG